MGLQSIVNKAGNIYNALTDLSPKQFYSIADFYHFIKKAQNCPIARTHFTVVPKICVPKNGIVPDQWQKIFTDTNLAKFAISIQQMDSGRIELDQAQKARSPVGQYMMLGQKSISSAGTVSITFIQTAQSIVQMFIVPWMYQTIRNTVGAKVDSPSRDMSWNLPNLVSNFFGKKKGGQGQVKNSVFGYPSLTLDVKFYRSDQIAGLQFLMNPTYVYRFNKVRPISVSMPTVQHGTNTLTKRRVSFAYNSCVCLPDPQWAQTLCGKSQTAFAYTTQSPVQLLNSINSLVSGTKGIIDEIKR